MAQKYIAEFNKDYPDIKVTYKNFENVDYRNTITPALDSGKGPDVFDLSPAGGSPDTWGPYALDLTSLAKDTLGDGWKDKIGGDYVKQLTSSDGRFVSLPLGGMSAGFLWYNKDILDKAGAQGADRLRSWVDTCKKVDRDRQDLLHHGRRWQGHLPDRDVPLDRQHGRPGLLHQGRDRQGEVERRAGSEGARDHQEDEGPTASSRRTPSTARSTPSRTTSS